MREIAKNKMAKNKAATTLPDQEISHLSPKGTINKKLLLTAIFFSKMFLREIKVISPS